MKKIKYLLLILLLLCGCSTNNIVENENNNINQETTNIEIKNDKTVLEGATFDWEVTGKKYENFTDLGNYVILCDPYEHFDFDAALERANDRYDKVTPIFGCSALGTKTDAGDVIIGRNLDLTVSQYPCYITRLKYGKYETLNFSYDQTGSSPTYEERLALGYIEPEFYNFLPMMAADSMNSEGLYIQADMRDFENDLVCFGTNPDAPIRACTLSLPFIVASNCATINEALKFIQEELNLYTMRTKSFASGWNMAYMMGDATGNYGLLEIAADKVRFLPQQHGQGNYYIYPEFNAISRGQSGYGRLQFGLERINEIQSDEDMAKMMENIMWRNEILNIPYACRDKLGNIQFWADAEHTVPSLDWRSDNVKMLPVNKFGRYVDIDDDTPEAMLVRVAKQCYDKYMAGVDPDINVYGYNLYKEYLDRCDLVWVHSDCNFEDLQKGMIRHYTESGIFDKLNAYYSGDEKALRDDGCVWTTALSLSVNCTQKRLTIKFWEQHDTVMHFQW